MGQDQTAAGIIPYAPSAQLWSDGTLKSRFIAMPGLAQATWRLAGGWGFPEKSVLVKNFLLPTDERDPQGTARRIETRILYRRNGDWHGFSYEWNAAGTDAELLVEGKDKPFTITGRNGQPVSFDYHFPSRSQCNACHTAAAGGVLGLNTPQMNAPFEYPQSGVVDNQLRTLDHIGLFGEPLPALPAQLPAMPDPFDAAAPLNGRARAYLAANCVQCHQPGATAPTSLDLRWEVANGEMNAIDVIPGNGDLGIDGARIVKPLDPARSVLLQRMNRRDHLFQMPPLATDRVDEGGVALIEEWISSGVFGMSAVRGSDWMMFE